jgi:predicted aspartyl protease
VTRAPYDRTQEPPAPVLAVRLSAPGMSTGVLWPGLLDSGADCTLVPTALVTQLGLPQVDTIAFQGVGGGEVRSTVHAARLELGGGALVARVVSFGDEVIVGRDVLNQCVLRLDGPALEVELRWPRRRARSR